MPGMGNTNDIDRIGTLLGEALATVLGSRLAGLIVYGSAAQGDYINGFSDFDVLAFVRGTPHLDAFLQLQDVIGEIDPSPFAYLQWSGPVDLEDAASYRAILVPGGFRILTGPSPDARFLHTEESLRASGEAWLDRLPAVAARDVQDWAFATGAARTRMLRLLLTRLKPALRAWLVAAGAPVFETWTASFPELAARWQASAPEAGEQLREVLLSLPAPPAAEASIGRAVIQLTELIVSQKRAR